MTSLPPDAADTAGGDTIDHDQLDALVRRLRLGTTASELHGSLCGYLAGGGIVRPGALFAELQLDSDGAAPSAADQETLDTLVHETQAALADPEMGFEPPIRVRTLS